MFQHQRGKKLELYKAYKAMMMKDESDNFY